MTCRARSCPLRISGREAGEKHTDRCRPAFELLDCSGESRIVRMIGIFEIDDRVEQVDLQPGLVKDL